MKTILSLFFLLPFVSSAQYSKQRVLDYLTLGPGFVISNQTNYDYYMYPYQNENLMKTNHVSSVKICKVKKNGKKHVESERTFNENGLLTKEVNDYATTVYTYDGTLLTNVVKTVKKKEFVTHADYDQQNRVVRIVKTKGGKLTSEYHYEYFEGNKTSLVEQINYGRKTNCYKYVTEYDELLKTAKRSQYFVNGVLKRNWTYSCDEKGEMVEKKVVESASCEYNARNNDGSYIEYTRSIREGKVYLLEKTFTKDSLLIDTKQYYKEKILIAHIMYDGNSTVSEYFNNRGKRYSKYSNTVDSNGNAIAWRSYTRRDKVKFSFDSRDNYFINFEYTFF
jgi:hypothetical protein